MFDKSADTLDRFNLHELPPEKLWELLTYLNLTDVFNLLELYSQSLTVTPVLLDSLITAIEKQIMTEPAQIIQIAAGFGHSLAVSKYGDVYVWGQNDYGQLGLGDTNNRLTSTHVIMPAGVKIIAVAAGKYYSLALADNGKVYGWGNNTTEEDMQYGIPINTNIPVHVATLPLLKIAAITKGQFDKLIRSPNGIISTRGWNPYTHLGFEEAVNHPPTVSTALVGINFVQIAAKDFHSLALSDAGDVYSWGANRHGQLGFGLITIHAPTLTHITQLHGIKIKKVTAGQFHSLAVSENNDVFTWGRNNYGQLGSGDAVDHLIPTRIFVTDIRKQELLSKLIERFNLFPKLNEKYWERTTLVPSSSAGGAYVASSSSSPSSSTYERLT